MDNVIPPKYKPFISICIPTYNRKEFLIESVKSAIEQSYPNFEIVVVDDCSNYNVEKDVLGKFKKYGKKIRFFRNERNMGRPFTRNKCIEKANGEFILWLDDDDKLLPNTLESYVEILNKYKDVDIIYGKIKLMGEDTLFYDTIDFYKNNELLAKILIKGCSIPNPSVLVKREIYDKYGKYNEEFLRAQDYEFWTRVALNSVIKKCDKPTVEYRIHEGSISYCSLPDNAIDTSYESLIIRKFIHEDTIKYIFPDDLDNLFQIEKEISENLSAYLDIFNSLYYGFYSSIEQLDNKEMIKKAILAIKMDNLSLAEEISTKLDSNSKSKVINLISLYKKFSKKLNKSYNSKQFHSIKKTVSNLESIFSYTWLSLYYRALSTPNNQKKLAKSYAMCSLLLNPFSKKTKNLMLNLGYHEKEIEAIKNRILRKANFLEENKQKFINQYFC